MSEHLEGRGAAVDVKLRRPWAVAGLSIVTLNIYSVYWYYKVNREMRDLGSACGDRDLAGAKPWRSVVAITIGGVVLIPPIVSLVRTVRRLQHVERLSTGSARGAAALIALVVASQVLCIGRFITGTTGLWLVLIGSLARVLATALMQARLNAVWRRSELLTLDASADQIALA